MALTEATRGLGGEHERRRMTPTAASRPVLGAGLMIAAMLIIPLADGIAKQLTGTYSAVFVSWARFLASAALALPVALVTHKGRTIPRGQLLPQVARVVFLVGSMTSFYVAISRVPLADALGAYFMAPIIASLLAVPVLQERLGRRKLIALTLGFAGTLLVVRPGASMDIGMLFAVGAGCSQAGFLVATRAAAQVSPPLLTVAFQFVCGAVLLTPFAVLQWATPGREALALITLMGLTSVVSHLLSINAFRFAQASTLSPLVYVELVGATIIGFLVFGDLPTVVTWIGIVIIVLGGLYLLDWGRAQR